MYYYSLLLTIGVVLTLGCGSSETNKNGTDSQGADTNTVKQSQDTMPPPPAPDLSPGTARIQGQAVDIREPERPEEDYRIAVRVNKVLGYGSSTPPIGRSDTLTIGSYTLPESIEKGKEFVSVISYRQIMSGFDDTPLWLLVRIEQN